MAGLGVETWVGIGRTDGYWSRSCEVVFRTSSDLSDRLESPDLVVHAFMVSRKGCLEYQAGS